jgi:PAS domain S-box-containing protein
VSTADTDTSAKAKPSPVRRRAGGRPAIGELPHLLLFERNPVPTMVYERETLKILAVSDSAVRNYGYSRPEFVKLTLRDLTPPEELDWLHEVAVGLKRHHGLSKQRPRHVRKDGSIIEVEATGDDILVAGRQCRIVLCEDVTERNRALAEVEATREQLRASAEEHRILFDRSPQPLVVYDCETLAIVAVSHSATVALGYTREEFLSMTLLDIAPESEHELMVEYAQRNVAGVEAGLQLARPRRQLRKDGTVIDVEVTSDDLVLRGRPCRAAISVDVTERNRTSAELAIARDRAVEASNLKSAFLANMSHEIRTPMNGVIGMTELLLGMELDEEQRECAEHIASSGEQMLAIINDILDISKIETGKLELDVTDFDLHETLERSCAAARMQASAKGLSLELTIGRGVPRRARGDARRLHQVLLNLVANAVKFTSTGSVAVSAVTVDCGGAVRIAVADTGIGIDPELLEDMFEPFTQADASTTRNYGGTGLGLAIARELVELMGGSIGADSARAAGSTFWFEVPLGPADDNAASGGGAGEAVPSWSRPPVVLVAEDSPINQIVAQRALERCGCEVEVVADGQAALDALDARTYDVVLMDCQMPVMDGYSAVRELRRRERGNRHTTVIAMTAQAMAGDREACLEAGMDDFISKPMRYADLARTLSRWVPAG